MSPEETARIEARIALDKIDTILSEMSVGGCSLALDVLTALRGPDVRLDSGCAESECISLKNSATNHVRLAALPLVCNKNHELGAWHLVTIARTTRSKLEDLAHVKPRYSHITEHLKDAFRALGWE